MDISTRRQHMAYYSLRSERAGARLAIDFHDFEESIGNYTSVMLVTDRFSGYIWDFYLQDRPTGAKVP
jgi:hypothetical protein